MTTVDFGWALTDYLFVSLVLLFATSFTTFGWIIHGLILLPIFSIVLVLPVATIRVSPNVHTVALAYAASVVVAVASTAIASER